MRVKVLIASGGGCPVSYSQNLVGMLGLRLKDSLLGEVVWLVSIFASAKMS